MKNRTPRLYETILTIGLISILASMSLAWFLVSNQLRDYFIKEAIQQNLEISNSITTYIEDKLKDAVSHLTLIEKSLDLEKSTSEEINSLIHRMNQVDQTFIDIEVVDLHGKVINTLPEYAKEIGFDRSREPFFIEFGDQEDVYWSNVQLSPYTDSNTITIAIHSHVGYLVGYLDLNEIQELSKVYISEFGAMKDISIADKYGIFIINKDQSLVDERRVDPNHEMALRIINGEDVFVHSEDSSEPFLITSNKIQSTGWIVSISEPYRNAISGIDYVFGILLTFGGIMLLIYALMLWRGNAKVIQDIKTFTRRLTEVSLGSNDETGRGYFKEFESLHESFNAMVGKIDDRDKKLSNLAYHDVLTGFHNRAYLDEVLLDLEQSREQKYAVIYLDLDNFSHINDTYGHHVGDQLLMEFSKKLTSVLDPSIDIIRLGGDEFILIIREMTEFAEGVYDQVLRIMSISNGPIQCGDRWIYFTLSAGISLYPEDGADFWTLLRNADTAMYAAKAAGKNTFSYFTYDMNASIEKRLTIEQHLRPALKNNEFKLVFQPQFTLNENKIRGFEALARWNNQTLGQISPVDFIEVAEDNKMIIPLGRWVMKKACETIKTINEQYRHDFIMAVNVSPMELKEFDYVSTVIDIVKETGIRPQWLEIEITENISIDKFITLKTTLEKLHEFGISISIDDFGTGYSSLAYLQKIPLDVLKVDRSFIMHLGETNDQNLMTETIFLMAKKLGLMTIAEGVETIQHIEFLKELDCDFVQGFLLSRPLSYDDLILLIEQNFQKRNSD